MNKTILKKLAQTAGPSGYESGVREIIREEIREHVSDIRVDALGNLMARVGKKADNGLRIMVISHMDEVGIIASHIEKSGLVRFGKVGAIPSRYLPASRVRFLNGTRGVINSDKPEDASKKQSIEKYFVNIGVTSNKDCEIKIGDMAVFDGEFVELDKHVVSKALDDRAGCAVLIEVIKLIKNSPHELVFVFSTQEEVGSKGALTAAFGIFPDLEISLDITQAGNPGEKTACLAGNGPAIKLRDANVICDPRVVDWMIDTAQNKKVPYQFEIYNNGPIDPRLIQIVSSDMLSGGLLIPCRFVHSPSEMVNLDDCDNTIKLLVELLNHPARIH